MKKLMRIVFILAFSKNFKRLLKIIAKSADEIAPIKINETSFILIPSRIKFPKPPAPIKAASVAVPMTITVLVRIPAMIKGFDSSQMLLQLRLKKVQFALNQYKYFEQ